MDLYIKVNKYKKIILTILLYFIVGFIVLGNIVKVKAEPSFYDTNSPDYGRSLGLQDSGNFGYLPSYDGIVISICSKAHGCIESSRKTYINIVYTFGYNEKTAYGKFGIDRTNVPNLSFAEGTPPFGGWERASVIFQVRGYIPEFSGLDYSNGNVATTVDNYLTESGYENLREILDFEAKQKGSNFENYFKKGDFVFVEPYIAVRTASNKPGNTGFWGILTVNGFIAKSDLFSNTNVGSVSNCPQNPCPTSYWLKPIIINMLKFMSKPGLDCSINNDITYASGYSSRREGCGYFKYNLDDILKPQNPTCTYDEKNNNYYGNKGTIVTESEFAIQCPKTCTKVSGSSNKYYNSKGTIVSYNEYLRDNKCNPSIPTGGKATIIKIDKSTGQEITTSPVTFELYNNRDCELRVNYDSKSEVRYRDHGCCVTEADKNDPNKKCACSRETKEYWKDGRYYYNGSSTLTFTGHTTLDISGTIYLLETEAPKGFSQPTDNNSKKRVCTNSSCWATNDSGWSYQKNKTKTGRCIAINPGDTIKIENSTDCETMFNDIKYDDMDARIWAFRYFAYFINDYEYYNFLNLNITDSGKACEKVKPQVKQETMCLSGQYDSNRAFTEDNISNFNYFTATSDGRGIAYCQLSFDLTNKLGSSSWNVKSGEMPIQYANPTVAATGKLRQACYLYPLHSGLDTKPDYFPTERGEYVKYDYSDIVTGVYFGEGNNSGKLNSKLVDEDSDISGTKWVDYTDTIEYSLYPVYAENITGKISYIIPKNNGNNYKFLGYGVVSRFDAKNSYYIIPYSIKFGYPLSGIFGSSKTSNECKVYPKQEIITTSDNNKTSDKLNLSFRIIDTSNPFPGKSGTVRKVGTNWKATSAVDDETAYNNWVSNSWKSSSLYINNNKGNATSKDYGFNSLVAYVMETTNNSLDKNKTGPIYTIKLTPTNIKEIREYNKNNDYDDFTLKCQSDATNCTISETFVKVVGKENFVKNI